MAQNTASILKQRIVVKRLVKTSDGYGGTLSSSQTTIGTFWCQVQEESGDVINKDGIRLRDTRISIIIRRETSDLIQNEDVFNVEGNATQYRINGNYQTFENFWVKMSATKVEA
jgi:head-tail adaptor